MFGHWKDWSERYDSINDLTRNKTEFELKCELEHLFLYHTGDFINRTKVFTYGHYEHNYDVDDWAKATEKERNGIKSYTKDKIDWEWRAKVLKAERDAKEAEIQKQLKKKCDAIYENLTSVYEEIYEENYDMDSECADIFFPTTDEPAAAAVDLSGVDPNDPAAIAEAELNQLVDSEAADAAKNLVGDSLGGVDKMLETIGISWNTRGWINMFHQMMLFILIFGRWMLPRNSKVSRDQLSQILLTFIGIAADMLEFVTETRKDLEIMCSDILLLMILGIWSWSTLQFFLVLTSKGRPTTRQVPIFDSKHASPIMWIEEEIEMHPCVKFWLNPEVWSICSSLCMQDMPFLSMRLYVIFGKNVTSMMLYFFTLKNSVVFMLQVYRLIVIATHQDDEEEEDEENDAPVNPNFKGSRAGTRAKSSAQSRGLGKG